MFIHMDPVGGIAGDMFIAAILDAWPNLKSPVFDSMRKAGLPSDWSVKLISATSSGIVGKRLSISGDANDRNFSTGTFSDVSEKLSKCGLPVKVIERAIDIFHRLAEAEGVIHGKAIDEVHFHEIADWDSIADIVGAATVLEEINCSKWSIGDIPMGSGTILTAHGRIPVPAPATSLLLEGYRMVDDGIPGERVTPTGAAILSHISATQGVKRKSGRLIISGHGLGTRKMSGAPNLLRILAFDEDETEFQEEDGVGEITFEVDDQTGEDLAIALEKLRDIEGVLDVVQYAVSGKKGRLANSIRILCRVDVINSVCTHSFLQTTTIGLRTTILQRKILKREDTVIDGLGAKKTIRPDGNVTIKVNLDDLNLQTEKQYERSSRRRLLEGGSEDEKI